MSTVETSKYHARYIGGVGSTDDKSTHRHVGVAVVVLIIVAEAVNGADCGLGTITVPHLYEWRRFTLAFCGCRRQ